MAVGESRRRQRPGAARSLLAALLSATLFLGGLALALFGLLVVIVGVGKLLDGSDVLPGTVLGLAGLVGGVLALTHLRPGVVWRLTGRRVSRWPSGGGMYGGYGGGDGGGGGGGDGGSC
jgi:hypothetical protein